MGLKELENRLRKDAENKINSINKRTEEEIKKIRYDIEREAEINAEKIIRDGKKEAKLTYRRIIADAVIKSREAIEAEKNSIIDDVFERVKNKILKEMSDKERADLLNRIIDNDKDKVPNLEILIDKKYSSLIKGAKASNIGDFGVIIQSKNGTIRIDNTLNNKIKRLKVTLKPQIASILFKNGKTMYHR